MAAVVKQAKTTRHPWLVACDAIMDPEIFTKSVWYEDRCMFFEAQEKEAPRADQQPKRRVDRGDARLCHRQLKSARTSSQDRTRRPQLWWKETRRFKNCVELKVPKSPHQDTPV